MLEFYNVKVFNLKEAVISCRNAVRTELAEHTDEEFEKSLERAIKLSKLGGGSGHTSFRKGILVSFDMKYTQYITKQLQRYHWFEYDSSTSMMHRITKMDFSNCCNQYVLDDAKRMMQRLINEYQESPSYEKFMYVISNCPMGTELYVHVTTNYEQLATMYRQRINHKLKEDYGNFRAMVESLPYAKELIINNQ